MLQIFKNIKGDKAMWAIIGLLALFSFLPVYSASTNLTHVVGNGSTLGHFGKHILLLCLGFGIIYGAHRIPYNYFRGISIIMLPVIIILLLITLMQGTTIDGANASRWIRIPFIGLSFQTSSLGSVILLMYVSRYFYKYDVTTSFKSSLTKLWLPTFLVAAFIFPANFSTSMILIFMVFLISFICSYPIKYLFQIGMMLLLLISIYVVSAKAFPSVIPNRVDTWTSRIESFFDNKEQKENYQTEKAKIAIATGGISGVGSGKSVMKNFLPQSSSDFIYAIIVEEYGLIGGISLLIVYMMLLLRISIIINKTKEVYGKILVISLGLPIIFQALINMSVAVNILPVTGQNLPLISSGGTSIWTICLSLGIILGVSSNNAVQKETSLEDAVSPLDILSHEEA